MDPSRSLDGGHAMAGSAKNAVLAEVAAIADQALTADLDDRHTTLTAYDTQIARQAAIRSALEHSDDQAPPERG